MMIKYYTIANYSRQLTSLTFIDPYKKQSPQAGGLPTQRGEGNGFVWRGMRDRHSRYPYTKFYFTIKPIRSSEGSTMRIQFATSFAGGLLLLGFITGCSGLNGADSSNLAQGAQFSPSASASAPAPDPAPPSASSAPQADPLAGLDIKVNTNGLSCQEITKQADCEEQIKKALAAFPQIEPQLRAYIEQQMNNKNPKPSPCEVTQDGQQPHDGNAVVNGFNDMLEGKAPNLRLICKDEK